MKVGSSLRASCSGICPMEPVTSSANTTPTELGCAGLSRASRSLSPCGFMSGWQVFCVNTCCRGSSARALVIASCASWL